MRTTTSSGRKQIVVQTSSHGADQVYLHLFARIAMWIRKWQRDQDQGVDSPVPTQVVSNEEFIPRPQNAGSRGSVEKLIGELAEEKSKKLGMNRREFHAHVHGAWPPRFAGEQHMIYGRATGKSTTSRNVGRRLRLREKFPKGEYFIRRCANALYRWGSRCGFRTSRVHEATWVSNLKDNPRGVWFRELSSKRCYFDSETSIGRDLRRARASEINKNARRQSPRRPRPFAGGFFPVG